MSTETNSPDVSAARTSRLAVASLVLGILSLVLCVVGFVFAIPGLICGIMGMGRVKNSGGTQKGRGMAVTGTVLNAAALVLTPIVTVMMVIAVPNFVNARDAAQKAACRMNLRTIQEAKAVWALENKKKQSAVPAEADLFGAGKTIQEKPVCLKGGSYSLNAVDARATCSIRSHNN